MPPQYGFKRLKPAQNKFCWCDFTNFSKQFSADSRDFRSWSFHALHIDNLLNCCRHKYECVNFKIFQNLILGGFLPLGPTMYQMQKEKEKKKKLRTFFSCKLAVKKDAFCFLKNFKREQKSGWIIYCSWDFWLKLYLKSYWSDKKKYTYSFLACFSSVHCIHADQLVLWDTKFKRKSNKKYINKVLIL